MVIRPLMRVSLVREMRDSGTRQETEPRLSTMKISIAEITTGSWIPYFRRSYGGWYGYT